MLRTGRGDVVLMVVGTLLVGLSGYLFLAVIGHGRFTAATTAALSVTYLVGNIAGPGVFVALEQETSRVVSDALQRAAELGARLRRLAVIDSGLGLATLLILLALGPVLLSRVLDEQLGLLLALGLSVVGSAAVYFVRGVTGGRRRFRHYAITLMIDGGARIVGFAALAISGNTNPVAYAVALCAGPAISALLTFRGAGPRPARVPSQSSAVVSSAAPASSQLVAAVALLLVASVLAMIMANLAPVVVTALLTAEPVTAAGFGGAVVLTRVPLLFMGPIQALLLPGLTAAAAAGDRAHLRSTVTRGLGVIAVIGVVASAGCWFFGRPAIALLLGADRDTTSSTALVWLTASAATFMGVLLLQPVLIALRRHRSLVAAWLAGGAAFVIALALPVEPITRGVLAQVVGPVVTLLAELAVLISYAVRSRPPIGIRA